MASTTDFYTGTIFQNLIFLIRDWPHVTEFEFGIEGGENYMKKFLATNERQNNKIKKVRENIKSTFNKLSCALLPYPGPCVAGTRGFYNGCWKEMELEFKEVLQNVIEYLLSPDRVVIKKVNGLVVNGTQFYDLIVNFFELFKSGILPETLSILEATIERHMMSIVNECYEAYKKSFEKNQDVENINDRYEDFKEIALLKYQDAKKMGGQECEIKYREILEKQIDEVFELIENNQRRLEAEKEVAKQEIEELQRLYEEQLQKERHANEERLRIEQEKDNMEQEQYERLRTAAELKYNQAKEYLKKQEEKLNEQQKLFKGLTTAVVFVGSLLLAARFGIKIK
ncbi:hypothetical protein PVAND_009037 [Polypedilum vanderplanki]|uniref:Guanylate-binding protein N-terminal domain-containing protein n=1 Tax=Polypedilum vanderplanki TaxID=319348 RepID=A0A9J6CC85_POLVA|nr:hypothetical protein PVAND_009037 [Polypedilum vanderplanki]